MTKDVQRWADAAMFTSEPMQTQKPKVYLLDMTQDPLGEIAACAKMYKGEVVTHRSQVTDEERLQYFQDGTKTVLGAPFEAVNFHFLFEGVTRAFTHQLVRQRTAVYFQESMRFAVVQDHFADRVGLPPSLDGTHSWEDDEGMAAEAEEGGLWHEPTQAQQWRNRWDEATKAVEDAYSAMVRDGMPAEDARGLLPTNIMTRVHYITNLRNLIQHAGNRLCTQAQFEWRYVFNEIIGAIKHARVQIMRSNGRHSDEAVYMREHLAKLFAPVCYQQGKCGFKASFDRACTIRDRVDMNAEIGRPSSEWHKSTVGLGYPINIAPIYPAEWALDPTAAR